MLVLNATKQWRLLSAVVSAGTSVSKSGRAASAYAKYLRKNDAPDKGYVRPRSRREWTETFSNFNKSSLNAKKSFVFPSMKTPEFFSSVLDLSAASRLKFKAAIGPLIQNEAPKRLERLADACREFSLRATG